MLNDEKCNNEKTNSYFCSYIRQNMAKKENSWKKREGVVFSTNHNFNYNEPSDNESVAETLPPQMQNLVVSMERSGRAGKQVTIVKKFVGSDEALTDLGKTLKTKCGVGGSVKEGEIILQGDCRDKAVALLTQMGYKAKRGN